MAQEHERYEGIITRHLKGEQAMSQEPNRYEGIIEDHTVEVVMASSDVLEALRAPVFVDDLGDFRAVGRALLAAWRERVPGFGVGIQISHGSEEVEQFCTVGICLLYTSPSPRDRTRSRMPSSA